MDGRLLIHIVDLQNAKLRCPADVRRPTHYTVKDDFFDFPK